LGMSPRPAPLSVSGRRSEEPCQETNRAPREATAFWPAGQTCPGIAFVSNHLSPGNRRASLPAIGEPLNAAPGLKRTVRPEGPPRPDRSEPAISVFTFGGG